MYRYRGSIYDTESIHYPLQAKRNRTNITLDKLKSARKNLEPIVNKNSENYHYNFTKEDLENTEWASKLIRDIDRLSIDYNNEQEYIVNPVFDNLEILNDAEKQWIIRGPLMKQLIYVYDRLGYLINKVTQGELANKEILALEKPSITDDDIIEDTDLIDESIYPGDIKEVSAQTSTSVIEEKKPKEKTCPCDKKGFQICIVIKCGDEGKDGGKGACCCTTGGEGEDKDCTGTCGNVQICVNKCTKCDKKKDKNGKEQKSVVFVDEREKDENQLKYNEYENNLNKKDDEQGEDQDTEEKKSPSNLNNISKNTIENFMMHNYYNQNNYYSNDQWTTYYNLIDMKFSKKWTIYQTRDYFYNNIEPNQPVSDLRLRNKANTLNLHEKYHDFQHIMLNFNYNFPWILPLDEIKSPSSKSSKVICYQYIRYQYKIIKGLSSSRTTIRSINYDKRQLINLKKEYSDLEEFLNFCQTFSPIVSKSLESLKKIKGNWKNKKNCLYYYLKKCKGNDAVNVILECLYEYWSVKKYLTKTQSKCKIHN